MPPQYLLKPRTSEWIDPNRWRDLEKQMHNALCQAASRAALPQERLLHYGASATHQEILMGIGSTAEAARHVFAFCKSSTGREDAALRDLKADLRGRLGANVSEFSRGDAEGLCRMVMKRLAQAIKEQASLFRAKTALEAEIEQHDAFARERIRFFTGRKELLQASAST